MHLRVISDQGSPGKELNSIRSVYEGIRRQLKKILHRIGVNSMRMDR